jgi:hypothetical protein
MKFQTVTILFLMAGSSAFAQPDASKLWAKYGPPLDRETFAVRPGVEMVVDYGPAKQVCRIQLPSGTQYGGTVPDGAVTKTLIQEILEEVVPASKRGKEVTRMAQIMGLMAISSVEYEHVTITESSNGNTGNGITVTIKDASCPSQKRPLNQIS